MESKQWSVITRRIGARLGLLRADASYDEWQRLFMGHLPREVRLYNEYHALLVALDVVFVTLALWTFEPLMTD